MKFITIPKVREAQAEQVLDLAQTVAKKVDLLVVGGDLNSSPDSKVYSKFLGEGLTDPQIELENSREPRFHTWGHEKILVHPKRTDTELTTSSTNR